MNLRVHGLQAMVEIGQHMLELFLIFTQRQILHFRITQGIAELAIPLVSI
ncbi:MAG: hypothetical protein U0236_14305 [Nitrospira sp.]